LSNKLAVTQESLDTTRRDNAELKSRISDLQSQMDKLQRLIELKNNQLAKLQAEGEAGAPAPAAAPAPAMTAELTPNAAPAPAEMTPAAVPAPVPAETPVEPTPAASDDKQFNELLTNPWLLGLAGGGALVVMLLLLLLARRRKAQQEAEKHLRMARALAEEQPFSADLDLPESSFEGLEVPPPSVNWPPRRLLRPLRLRPRLWSRHPSPRHWWRQPPTARTTCWTKPSRTSAPAV
jgi:pilus assembly protein FimV